MFVSNNKLFTLVASVCVGTMLLTGCDNINIPFLSGGDSSTALPADNSSYSDTDPDTVAYDNNVDGGFNGVSAPDDYLADSNAQNIMDSVYETDGESGYVYQLDSSTFERIAGPLDPETKLPVEGETQITPPNVLTDDSSSVPVGEVNTSNSINPQPSDDLGIDKDLAGALDSISVDTEHSDQAPANSSESNATTSNSSGVAESYGSASTQIQAIESLEDGDQYNKLPNTGLFLEDD